MFTSSKDPEEIVRKLNEDILSLSSGLNDNKLMVKSKKCEVMFNGTHQRLKIISIYMSNDICVSLDTGDEVILILLDFSSAFDTLKHDIILHRLKGRFGIKGLAYQWFETYLKNRQQKVVINGVESSVHTPGIGVPQGSVVGPILFTMYASPLEDIIKAHNMSGMCYADDTQIYLRFKPCDLQKAIQKVECCIKHIKQWCTLNNLKLNDEKTEVLHLTSRFRSRLQLPIVKVDNSPIVPSDKVKNLGVIFDRHMVMDRFVSLKCKSASFQLHRLGKIRQYLDTTTAKKTCPGPCSLSPRLL